MSMWILRGPAPQGDCLGLINDTRVPDVGRPSSHAVRELTTDILAAYL